MAYKDKAKQREYQRDWVRQKRGSTRVRHSVRPSDYSKTPTTADVCTIDAEGNPIPDFE